MEKVSLLKQMPHDWLQQQTNTVCSPKSLPYAGLISSLTTFQNHVILCDMGMFFSVCQSFLKYWSIKVKYSFHFNSYNWSWTADFETKWRIWSMFDVPVFKLWATWIAVLAGFLLGESLCSVCLQRKTMLIVPPVSSAPPPSFSTWIAYAIFNEN